MHVSEQNIKELLGKEMIRNAQWSTSDKPVDQTD